MLPALEKLQKFFKLEKDRGFDNRAIVGGLDKILPAWEPVARQEGVLPEWVDAVVETLSRYGQMDEAARSTALTELLERIRGNSAEPSPSARPVVVPSSPPPTRRESDSRRPEGLSAPLTVLPGIGPKYAQTLEGLGLRTLENLLYYFPRRYDDYSKLKPINRLAFGEEVTVIGTLTAIQSRPIKDGKMQMTEAVLDDTTGKLRLAWFNRPWLTNQFHAGNQVVVSGKLDMRQGRLMMNSPEIETLEQEHLHTNRIVPVYSLTSGVTQRFLRKTMYQVVSFWAQRVPDFMPASVRASLKLIDLGSAIYQTHFPDSQDQLDQARWRLAFDEIFLIQLGVLRQKRSWQAVTARTYDAPEDWLDEQFARLPYALTGAQRRALADIRSDLASGKPMERLLQGDVGSGKTVVAALAAQMVIRSGAQAAFMAPTSILAEQHFRGLNRLLVEPNGELAAPLQPGEVRLLAGATPESEKQAIRAGLASGEIRLLVGTHALLEDPVVFQDLQLAVIDEQHRFGVAQRAALRSKGNSPHLLVMTATPIPRSLALTVYGDLDLSVMDELPAGRKSIETHVLPPMERERAYQLIRSQIELGHQAFIIYPKVESEEDNGEELAAVQASQKLQKEVFPRLKIGLLHGRMKADDKDAVMARFRDRELNILVSTSVVEVGVDVPNATLILIEGANRFGLAQLHQFRGRVGRGSAQSYCLLIPDTEDAVENERLQVMAETNDGFVLAERDLQQRGPGEFLGTRQAGFTELQMAGLTDVMMIEKARKSAQSIFEVDPDLSAPEHQPLIQKLESFWGNGRGDVS